MPPGYCFLVAPLQQSPSPRVTSCLCWLVPHPAACSFSTPFPSCQRFLAAEVAAGHGGSRRGAAKPLGGSSPGTGDTEKFGIEEQTGASWLAQGCLEPDPAPAAAWLLLHPLTAGSGFGAGSGCAAPAAASRGGSAPGARSPSLCRAREVARRVPRPCPGAVAVPGCLHEQNRGCRNLGAAALPARSPAWRCSPRLSLGPAEKKKTLGSILGLAFLALKCFCHSQEASRGVFG